MCGSRRRRKRDPAGGRRRETLTVSLADEDDPDPVIDGKIDLGALAAEFFALGLDPYPRKPGVEFVAPAEEAASRIRRSRPSPPSPPSDSGGTQKTVVVERQDRRLI